MLRRQQMKRDTTCVLRRTGSEARSCQIQRCIFKFKPPDFHKSKFSSSEIFIWLGRSFMISENEVLKTACGPNGEQVLWERRELRIEELHNLCSSPNITMLLNWGCIRKNRSSAGFEEIKIHEECNIKKLKGRDLVVDTGLYDMIILSVIEQTKGGTSGSSSSTCYWHSMFYKIAVLFDCCFL